MVARCNRIVPLFALACACAVATVYFAHPLLVTMGQDLGIAPAVLGAVVTTTQIGYGLGLFLLVPLGDLVNRRRLVTAQFALLAAALLTVGTASTLTVLLTGMAAVGLLAVVTQSLVAFAASLAEPARRGRVLGTVTSGVVSGILVARTVSGVVSDLAGWRAVYLAAAGVCALLAVTLHLALPDTAPNPLRYGQLLRSTVRMFAREPVLRARSALAVLVFAAFSVLWSSVTLPLSAMSLSHTAIGAFGLAGLAGALAASPAGRLHDRGLGQWTTGTALGLLVLSWVPLALTQRSLWALAVGAVLLDLAVQAVHVTNQSMIYAVRQDAGSRVIGGYMVFYSIGSGTGAIAATAAYSVGGWPGVCALGAAISLLALVVWAVHARVHANRVSSTDTVSPAPAPPV